MVLSLKNTSYKSISIYRISCYAKRGRTVTNSPPEEKTFNGLERKSGRTDEKTPKKRMWGLRFSGEKIGVPVDMSVRLYADTLA